MPRFEIETPQGRFEVEAPDEQSAIQAVMQGGASSLSPSDRDSPIPDDLIRRGREAVGTAETMRREQSVRPGTGIGWLDAATEYSLPFSDEIGAAMMAPIEAAKRYGARVPSVENAKEYFQLVGEEYERGQKERQEAKERLREEHPIAATAGGIAGGLALGGTLAKGGVTLANRMVPGLSKTGSSLATAGAEGAGYGAFYGADEAGPGERLKGAAMGAVFGAATGVAVQGIGNALATRAARVGAKKTAQSAQQLKEAAGDLFDASEASGVSFKPAAVETLGKRLKLAAGRINDKLRPKTAGYADELDELFKGQMSLEEFEEFRQVLGKELRTAGANDARTLGAMKRVLDDFADRAKSTDFIGDRNGIELLKAARQKWAQAKKTEILENILDRAEVKTGQYTQSGLANTIRREMETLYGQIQKGKVKGFSDEEVDLIRRMASGGSSSQLLSLVARFAPRGPISIVLGQALGSLIPGGNIAVPVAGAAAANMKDRAAMQALEILRLYAAGEAPTGSLAGQVSGKASPFIGGAVSGETQARRVLLHE